MGNNWFRAVFLLVLINTTVNDLTKVCLLLMTKNLLFTPWCPHDLVNKQELQKLWQPFISARQRKMPNIRAMVRVFKV